MLCSSILYRKVLHHVTISTVAQPDELTEPQRSPFNKLMALNGTFTPARLLTACGSVGSVYFHLHSHVYCTYLYIGSPVPGEGSTIDGKRSVGSFSLSGVPHEDTPLWRVCVYVLKSMPDYAVCVCVCFMYVCIV